MSITMFGSATRAQLDEAVNRYESTLRHQFAEMDWCLTRWLLLVSLHLVTQGDTPSGVRWAEHKLTYRDFIGLYAGLDDNEVCEIVRLMTVILTGDVLQTVGIAHAGSQVVFTLHTP